MRDLVVDASALIETLLRSPSAATVDEALASSDPLAPDLLDAEVLATLVRLERRQAIDQGRAARALGALRSAPIERVATTLLAPLAWALRGQLGPAHALYVALARRLGCPLLTADARLARTPGLPVPVMLVGS